jgi:hypothetical protein
MSATIEYYEENTGRFRAVTFGAVPPATTKEQAEAVLKRLKIKFSKIVGFK